MQPHNERHLPADEREIVQAARAAPTVERDRLIRRACGGDSNLEDRVRRQLAAGEATAVPAEPDRLELDPEMVGPYRILERIGAGGMGVVYVAEQTQPVRRRVALKVVKAGMDTREVIARFHAERQALAMMSHPNIARIIDAGATAQGRPYFVMEHVAGVPLLEYCDRKRLGIEARLAIFVDICMAVQHAHQKGIIHRDIKPSNVLVAEEDGAPVPKVIDFGIAKAVTDRLGDLTVHTALGRLIGTPDYMSPEQAEGTALDVDTRADVYALGAVLYHLLSGSVPFDFSSGDLPLVEIQRLLRDRDPLAPGERLAADPAAAELAARDRGLSVAALRRRLRGDLTWITMKALEKERARRYPSASELAEDVRRHLAGEPVAAGPPGLAYRLGKLARRHAPQVALVAIAAVALVAFAVRERAAAVRIAREAAAVRQVSEFLVDLFQVSDPSQARGERITAREILDRGAAKIEQELQAQPAVQARLLGTIGRVYANLGLYDRARPLLEETLARRRELLGAEHPDTLESMASLATLATSMGRYDDAERLSREVIDARRRALGDEHPATLSAMAGLSWTYRAQGRYAEAEATIRGVLELQERSLGREHPDAMVTRGQLASLYTDQGRFAEAEALSRQVLEERRRVQGPDHPSTIAAINNLANVYARQRRYADAEPLHRESLAGRRRVYGDHHPLTLNSLDNLASLFLLSGRLGEAEGLFLESLDGARRGRGADHPDTLLTMNNLAELYRSQGRYDEAEPLYRETLAGQERVLGREHPDTAITVHNLACLLRDRGRHGEAGPLFERAQAAFEAAFGASHPYVAENLSQHAALLRATGSVAEADRLAARAAATAAPGP